ncbi:MAG: ATP-binding protein [Anaerolineales bacterium]|jgi:PAS domain S-box-containing protein
MVKSFFRPTLQIFNQTNFGIDQGRYLLDFIEKPALIFDTFEKKIIAANTHVTELTAFTRDELMSLSVLDLFPNIHSVEEYFKSQRNVTLEEDEQFVVISRNKQKIPVELTQYSLDDNGTWLLCIIEPLATRKRDQKIIAGQRELIKAIKKLSYTNQLSDLRSALNLALEAGNDLTAASELAIYGGADNQPKLRLIAHWGDSRTFPFEIPLNDLIQLNKPYLWVYSRQDIISELHRCAYSNEFNYLASAPLGETGAMTGLIVLGNKNNEAPKEILRYAEILASTISGFIQKDIMIINLKKALKKNENKLTIGSKVIESVQDGVILLTPKLTIIDMNPIAELILGYATPEIEGQTIYNVLIGSDSISPALQSALRGIATHNLGNINLHRRDGSTFPARVQTLPISRGEDVIALLVLLRDLSEHEQIRLHTQQLEQRALLGEVTAILAHEIKNPINNISTGLQLMALELKEDESIKEQIDRLQQDLRRLNHLMESVLIFSRSKKYDVTPIDLSYLIKLLLDRWRPRMARLNIQHRIQIEPNTPKVLGDNYALEQVFTNLISNAVQAMNEIGGTLAVKLTPYSSPSGRLGVQVDVSDTGPGIPEEVLERIFEPFFTTNREGTGLGLAITKQIITAHKGNINVTSFPGGTVFHIWLPAPSH